MEFDIACISQSGLDETSDMAHSAGRFKRALQGDTIGEQDADEDLAETAHALLGLCLAHLGSHHGSVVEFLKRGGEGVGGCLEIGDCWFEEIIGELDAVWVEAGLRGAEETDGAGLEDLTGELFGG